MTMARVQARAIVFFSFPTPSCSRLPGTAHLQLRQRARIFWIISSTPLRRNSRPVGGGSMKALKAAAVACCVVGLMASSASAMQAQAPAPAPTPDAKAPAPAPKADTKAPAPKADAKAKDATFTGCVAPGKDPATFILTDVTAGAAAAKKDAPPKAVNLSSTSVKIDAHSGHKVTVVGPVTTDKGEATMTVTSLKMVSPTCP